MRAGRAEAEVCEVAVFDQGRLTDVMDTSVLTCGTDPAAAPVEPATRVLHPGEGARLLEPIVGPHSVILNQVTYGIAIRMAVGARRRDAHVCGERCRSVRWWHSFAGDSVTGRHRPGGRRLHRHER